MFFSIDPSGGVAIYEQIIRQIKFAIAEQTLRPGQLLPSVRGLSHQIAVNPNTVARAYQQLQSDGILESLRGRGLVVCNGAASRCHTFRQSLMSGRIGTVIDEALHGGLNEADVRQIVDAHFRSRSDSVPTISSPASSSSDNSSAEVPSHE